MKKENSCQLPGEGLLLCHYGSHVGYSDLFFKRISNALAENYKRMVKLNSEITVKVKGITEKCKILKSHFCQLCGEYIPKVSYDFGKELKLFNQIFGVAIEPGCLNNWFVPDQICGTCHFGDLSKIFH